MKKGIDLVYMFLLTFIALVVAIGLTYGVAQWKWITAYWVTLSSKNLFDLGWKVISKEK